MLNQIVTCISGLVVEYIVAIDVTRVRFPADAFLRRRFGFRKTYVFCKTDANHLFIHRSLCTPHCRTQLAIGRATHTTHRHTCPQGFESPVSFAKVPRFTQTLHL